MDDADDAFLSDYMPGGAMCPVSDSEDEGDPQCYGSFAKILNFVEEIKLLVEGSQKGKGAGLNKDQKARIVTLCNMTITTCFASSTKPKDTPTTATATPSASGTTPALTVETITKIVRSSIQEELKKLPSLQQISPSAIKPSYASIASANTPKSATNPKPVSKPSIIVSNKKETASREDTLRSFRTAADFKSLNFAPARVQSLSKLKFRVEFDSEEQRSETLKRLAKDPNLNAETARKLKPMVILKGVSKDIPQEELKDLILHQNPSIQSVIKDESDITFKFDRKNRNEKLYNAVFIVNPPVFHAMINLVKINVDYLRIHCEEFSPFLQCFKCLQFGHTRNKCSANTETCSHCTGTHDLEQCPVKGDAKKSLCLNCKTHNAKFKGKDNTSHRATSTKCPRVKAMLIKVREKIDYGVED